MELCFIKRKKVLLASVNSLTKWYTDCENKRRVRSVDNLGECNQKLLCCSYQYIFRKRRENNHMIKIVTRPVERVQVST